MPICLKKLPLKTPIDGKLVPGSKITVVGWPTEKCKSFSINLKLGPKDEEIALHISVRFKPFSKTPVVVRNSLTSAGWGQEERETPHFPFLPKESYKLEILCERARYRIFVDDTYLGVFTHRLPLAYVSYMEISGDTEVSFLEIPQHEFVGTPKGSMVDTHFNNLSLKDEDFDDNN